MKQMIKKNIQTFTVKNLLTQKSLLKALKEIKTKGPDEPDGYYYFTTLKNYGNTT